MFRLDRPVVRPVVFPLTSAFLSLRNNTEQISMKFAGGNHYHQQIIRLYYE